MSFKPPSEVWGPQRTPENLEQSTAAKILKSCERVGGNKIYESSIV